MNPASSHKIPVLLLLILMLPGFAPGAGAQTGNFIGNFNNANQLMTDVSGKPIYLKVDYNVEGSPFYPEEYYKANIFIRKGKAYTDVYVKFNLQENLVLFKMADGTELSATVPIGKVIFTDTSRAGMMQDAVFENGFPSIGKQNGESYYQVLDSGEAKLLKYFAVSFIDKKQYGHASITRVFDQTETHYICLPDGGMKRIEKGQEAFLSLFRDKKEELKKYMEQHKIKCRKEDDWKKVVAYYNSL